MFQVHGQTQHVKGALMAASVVYLVAYIVLSVPWDTTQTTQSQHVFSLCPRLSWSLLFTLLDPWEASAHALVFRTMTQNVGARLHLQLTLSLEILPQRWEIPCQVSLCMLVHISNICCNALIFSVQSLHFKMKACLHMKDIESSAGGQTHMES